MELIGILRTFKLVNRNAYLYFDECVYRIRVFILCTPMASHFTIYHAK